MKAGIQPWYAEIGNISKYLIEDFKIEKIHKKILLIQVQIL